MRKHVYSTKDLTAILDISKPSVINLFITGKLEHFMIGRMYRVTHESLIKYLGSEDIFNALIADAKGKR